MVSQALYPSAHFRSFPAFHPTMTLRKACWLGKRGGRRWLPRCAFEWRGIVLPMLLLLLVRLTACPRLHALQATRLPPSHPPTHCLTPPDAPQELRPCAGGTNEDLA